MTSWSAAWLGVPDVNALAAHGLSLGQLVGVLQQECQIVEATGRQGVIRAEGPLPDHQAAPCKRFCLLKATIQQSQLL